MTVAERTRDAVRARPFLYDALRAGVCNYTAAARYLDVGDVDAVSAALRRFAEELPEYESPTADARVRMESGFGEGDPEAALLVVGDTALVPDSGPLTAIVATGSVGPAVLRDALGRLAGAEVAVVAAGVGESSLAVVVERRDGPNALRIVEATVDGVA
ncbi:hypothetical protein ACKVMT_06020 [Halobacteriales archaeon Cl-PHB]